MYSTRYGLWSLRLKIKRRFIALERKLQRDLQLRHQYREFIKEYYLLGHKELRFNIYSNLSRFPHAVIH